MKAFMDEGFLLGNETAARLYNEYAKDMPIIDYHCHLSPKEIAEDKRYRNITEVWLGGDHYKWRAMRNRGVDERFITGDAPDKEKFLKWAETMPYCIGNPLYHWTHLELKRYFGIDKPLSPETAEEIWESCNGQLKTGGFSARGLIRRSNVEIICTTDDPADTLEYHAAIAADKTFGTRVLPTFRPDKAIHAERPGFAQWIGKLEAAAGRKIGSFADLTRALGDRLEFFHEMGCRISDHAMDVMVYSEASPEAVEDIFKRALEGKELSQPGLDGYKTAVLSFLGREYRRLGWAMQLHIGALRNVNSRMWKALGPDTGFDMLDDGPVAKPLASFLNSLERIGGLPKTILYCMNPKDNEVMASMTGCFQCGGIPGRVQFGSGWWFNDQKDGMVRQLTALAGMGMLGTFVGMLTDSRSFLSYTRHEYFRRILCGLIGNWAEDGEVPCDYSLLGGMVRGICHDNAAGYFGL